MCRYSYIKEIRCVLGSNNITTNYNVRIIYSIYIYVESETISYLFYTHKKTTNLSIVMFQFFISSFYHSIIRMTHIYYNHLLRTTENLCFSDDDHCWAFHRKNNNICDIKQNLAPP